MKGAAQRTTGFLIMGAAVLAYFARPWSCGLALSQFELDDPVPYADFDYHGWGVIFAWLAALLFAAPMLWLASKLFLAGAANFRVFGRARDTKATILSVAIAAALGAPMHSQLSYLIGLPISIAMPVVISSLAWLLVVEVGRTAAVERNLLDRRGVLAAATIAILVTVPKVGLVAIAMLQA